MKFSFFYIKRITCWQFRGAQPGGSSSKDHCWLHTCFTHSLKTSRLPILFSLLSPLSLRRRQDKCYEPISQMGREHLWHITRQSHPEGQLPLLFPPREAAQLEILVDLFGAKRRPLAPVPWSWEVHCAQDRVLAEP